MRFGVTVRDVASLIMSPKLTFGGYLLNKVLS